LIARESILTALFNLFQAMPGLITVSRRPRYWSDVPPEEQPAFFLGAGDQTVKNDPSGTPATWTLDATIYLYVFSGDDSVPPSLALNGYLDQIEALLAPPAPGTPWPMGFCSLGGLVNHVWINGPITTSGDVLGSQGIAMIPLQILANA